MYLTAEQYATLMGEAAPADFAACLDMAESLIDLHTMNFYAQMAFASLPNIVQKALQRAAAYQVSAISQRGGVSGMTEQEVKSASVGKTSYSVEQSTALCRPAAAIIPFLMAFARGYEG